VDGGDVRGDVGLGAVGAEVSVRIARRITSPESACSDSESVFMPKKKIPSPPRKVYAVSNHMGFPSGRGGERGRCRGARPAPRLE
jgi:hypothetical protein